MPLVSTVQHSKEFLPEILQITNLSNPSYQPSHTIAQPPNEVPYVPYACRPNTHPNGQFGPSEPSIGQSGLNPITRRAHLDTIQLPALLSQNGEVYLVPKSSTGPRSVNRMLHRVCSLTHTNTNPLQTSPKPCDKDISTVSLCILSGMGSVECNCKLH